MTKDSIKQRVPEDAETRRKIRVQAARLTAERGLLPPLTMEFLLRHTADCLSELDLTGAGYDGYAMIMLNNALWTDYFRAIPREQRLLLLPFCLRDHASCTAKRDDLGLICEGCGKCSIPHLSDEAEALGMPVLVAESSSRAAEWVEQGEIQAVIGVSCLDSLAKAFPSMLRYAVPALAVPLLRDGCADTIYDEELLRDVLEIGETEAGAMIPYADIRGRTASLFTPDTALKYLRMDAAGLKQFPQEIIQTLCGNGKHYRPMITFGIYCAMTRTPDIPESLNPTALAVECFHKASLIHDDIEDEDETRYGSPSLHRRIGLAAALNAGDFLIGEGYRLFGHESIPAEYRAELYHLTAQAHCELSLGQAREFELPGGAVTLAQCLETHRLKTAPAFRMSLYTGAVLAGQFTQYRGIFQRFADLLGVSYQLRDDLDDKDPNPASAVDCLMNDKQIDRAAARLEIAELYREKRRQTYEILEEIHDSSVKVFLYRLTGKVLNDV